MISDTKAQAIKDELSKDDRDVADLWTEALRKYKGIVGEELVPKFTSVDAMVAFGTQEMNNFHKFRHNDKKVDKLRSLFAANLDYIQKGAQQLIAAATPAFPPAAAIGTALTYMLSACKQVSADYDVVTSFFEDMNAFLQRITILESRLPKYPAYRNCLMDVFTSVLEMCGFATKYIELGRFKKWISNMIKGEDGDLGGARKKMDTSLSRLQSATEYAILGNTEELQSMNKDLQQNQDLQTRMLEDQTKMLDTVIQSQDGVRSDLHNIQKLLVMFDDRRKEDGSKQRGAAKASGQSKKPPTSNQVRSYFEDTLSPAHEYYNIKESFIPETCAWVFDEPLWETWLSQDQSKNAPRVLALLGPPGTGKSHLAASAYDNLVNIAEKDAYASTCVAHFYFRETTTDLCDLYNAIKWIVIQIAEQNASVCEKICAQFQQEDLEIDSYEWKDVWTKLVLPCFGASSKCRLRVVWDGLDELPDMEHEDLWTFLSSIKDTPDASVTFVCTSRRTMQESLEKLGAQVIEVTKEKQLPDLKALIWHHLNSDSGLKKFSKYSKQRISSTLEEKADGMLYAEHLLRQFSIFAREPLVLKALEGQMPGGLEGLYLNMVADLQHHTLPSELEAMKILLCWLCYSRRPLTLAECLSLLDITSNGTFDLERELQGRQLARILHLGDVEERNMPDSSPEDIKIDVQAQNKTDAPLNDGDLPLKFQERSMAGFFRGGSEGLRTLKKDGSREMFILCSDILCGRRPSAHRDLRQYAARYALFHLSWTQLQGDTELDRIRALNALGTMMSNETHAATVIETLGVDYEEINEDFGSGLLMRHMTWFAGQAIALGDKVNATTRDWATSVTKDVHTAFEPLAKGHVRNWFQADEPKVATRSFKFARSAFNMKDKVDAKPTTGSESKQAYDSDSDSDDEQSHYSSEEIITVFKAYDDIPKDANAYRVAAALFSDCNHHTLALTYCRHALKLWKDPVQHFRILNLLANIRLHMKEVKKADKAICEGLANRDDLTPRLLRAGLITRAKVEIAAGKKDGAIVSYEEARLAIPDEPLQGHNLKDAFKVFVDKDDDALLTENVKNWKAMEMLAWMTWNFEEDGEDDHEILQRAVSRAGQSAYLYEAYEEVIKLLENLNAAAPIRFQLAIAYWFVGLNAEASKTLMNETLDTMSSGYLYALTNEDPAYTLVCATLLMTQIIYEQYRATSDSALKSQLYTEIKGLTTRPLAQSIRQMKSEMTYYSLTVARMARKMAPAHEFQTMLDGLFNVCYEALIDAVGWNDWLNLNVLAAVVSSLDGLETEAQILLSAQFSKLDPAVKMELSDSDSDSGDKKVNGVKYMRAVDGKNYVKDGQSEDEDVSSEEEEEENADEDNEDKNDALSTDEDDLSQDVYCNGECKPRTTWNAWKDRPMYVCVTCSNTCLCEECYHKRQGYNRNGGDAACRDSVGTNYCGTNHKYVKGPIPGWKGITDGVMTIEGPNGEEMVKVKFREWLEELKNVKWKAAWEQFWLKED